MKIKYIIEVLRTKFDKNGNRYMAGTITSTETGRQLYVRDLCSMTQLHNRLRVECLAEYEEMHTMHIDGLSKREYNNSDAMLKGSRPHEVTCEILLALTAKTEPTTQINLEWHDVDVIDRVEELGYLPMTPEQVGIVLDTLLRRHDCNYGITWEHVDATIEEYAEQFGLEEVESL